MLDEIRSAAPNPQSSPTTGPRAPQVGSGLNDGLVGNVTGFDRMDVEDTRELFRIVPPGSVASAYSIAELERLGHASDHAKTARSMLRDADYDYDGNWAVSPGNLPLVEARLKYAKDALEDALAALDGDGPAQPDGQGRTSDARATILDGLRRIEAAQASLERLKKAKAVLDEHGGPGSFAGELTGAQAAYDEAREAFGRDLDAASEWGSHQSAHPSPYESDPLDFGEERRHPRGPGEVSRSPHR